MKKKQIAVLIVISAILWPLGVLTGCDSGGDSGTGGGLDITVSFVPLAAAFPSKIIDFSPDAALPAGVTYKLTATGWGNGDSANGFNGQINGDDHFDVANYDKTFTQTFYINGEEITGVDSIRTVVLYVYTTANKPSFQSLTSDTGPVTLKHP